MVSTINVRLAHSNYAGASPDIKTTVDEAFEAVVGVFQSAGLRTAMSDKAEELIAAIHHYYEQSAEPTTQAPSPAGSRLLNKIQRSRSVDNFTDC